MFSKISKKIVAGTLVTAVVLTSATVTAPDEAAAAKKAKLNKKSVTLDAGKTVVLSANAKAKWSTSDKSKASISTTSGKKCTVKGIAQGNCTITAKVGKSTATCKVKVNGPKAGTVIYDLAKERGSDSKTGESFAPPVKCNYSTFKYSSYAIWQCRAVFSDPGNSDAVDYRGKKIRISVTVKNSGKNDLAELGFCFNYTKGGSDGAYPFAYHMINSKLRAQIAKKAGKKWSLKQVKKDNLHKHAKVEEGTFKKGQTKTFTFDFTIPSDAVNGDKDPDTGENYPIMFYIPNLKDNPPYQDGDEITITKATFKLA